MKNGYQIAIILDNTFEVNYKNIESLKLFKYVLLNKNLKQFEQIKEENIKNIITKFRHKFICINSIF